MRMIAVFFAAGVLASGVARGQFAPPDPAAVMPATAPAPLRVESLEKLLASGDQLKLGSQHDAKPDQYLVRVSWHLPPVEKLQPNPLSLLVGRDKDKTFCVVYLSDSRVPLLYSTTGMSVTVSIQKPGQLDLQTRSPYFELRGNVQERSFGYQLGVADKGEIDVDMRSGIESLLPTVREAKMDGNRLTLRLLKTRAQFDFRANARADDLPIREVRVYANDDNRPPQREPMFGIAIDMGAPAAEFFKVRADDVRKLKVDAIADGTILSSAFQFKDYLMGDVRKTEKMMAAGRQLATLLPTLPAPIETPETQPAPPPASTKP